MAGKIVNYEFVPMGSFSMNSCWKSEKDGLRKDSDCQTSDELYAFDESGTQTSTYNDQGTQVSKVRSTPSLIIIHRDFDSKNHTSDNAQ